MFNNTLDFIINRNIFIGGCSSQNLVQAVILSEWGRVFIYWKLPLFNPLSNLLNDSYEILNDSYLPLTPDKITSFIILMNEQINFFP